MRTYKFIVKPIENIELKMVRLNIKYKGYQRWEFKKKNHDN